MILLWAKKLKRLLSHIRLSLQNENYTHTHTHAHKNTHTHTHTPWIRTIYWLQDCVPVCVSALNTACVSLRYYCRHAWEVFICQSRLPISCSARERAKERRGTNRVGDAENPDNGESEDERGVFSRIRLFLSVSQAPCFRLMVMDGPPLWNNGAHIDVSHSVAYRHTHPLTMHTFTSKL